MNKFIDHILEDGKTTETLSINISGDGNSLCSTVITIEKAVIHARSTAWRTERIIEISDCCLYFGLETEKKKYLQQTYGVDSLAMLSDTDIEDVHQWIMEKR